MIYTILFIKIKMLAINASSLILVVVVVCAALLLLFFIKLNITENMKLHNEYALKKILETSLVCGAFLSLSSRLLSLLRQFTIH